MATKPKAPPTKRNRAPVPAYHLYALDVVAGKIVAAKTIQQACARYLEWRHTKRHRFDPAAVEKFNKFCGFMRHVEGPLAGTPFTLEPWQQLIAACVFGFLHDDGSRVTRRLFVFVGRKNGKSFLFAALGLYLLLADGEAGPKIYSAATMRDQAKLLWSAARAAAANSPMLKRRLKLQTHVIMTADETGIFKPLGANTDSLDGLNPSGALIDELHAHRDNSMLTVLQTAMGARRQPLLGVISTAGTNPVENPCRIEQSYCERILDPANAEGADDYWPFVFQLDDGDDCFDESVWPKANPNLDVSISREYLRKQSAKARAVPEELAGFKTRHCNMWVDHAGPSIWIPHDQWSACAAPMPDEALVGLPCVAGLDGADVGDLFAYALAWLLADGRVYVRCHYWTTLGTLAARVQKERLAYDAWLQAGWLNATDTQANDLFAIAERIRADHDRFRFVEVRYDPHFLKLFAEQLTNAGIMCVEFRQTGSQFTEPGRAFSAAVRERRILHDGNPVTAWCVSNTRWKEFEDEKGMPMKIGKAHQRIDGLVASLMAHSGAVRVGNKPPVPELWMPAVRKW